MCLEAPDGEEEHSLPDPHPCVSSFTIHSSPSIPSERPLTLSAPFVPPQPIFSFPDRSSSLHSQMSSSRFLARRSVSPPCADTHSQNARTRATKSPVPDGAPVSVPPMSEVPPKEASASSPSAAEEGPSAPLPVLQQQVAVECGVSMVGHIFVACVSRCPVLLW